jgi:hypothetical protein
MTNPVNPKANKMRKWSRKIQSLRFAVNDFFTFAVQYSDEVNNLAQVRVRLDEVAVFSEKFEEYQSELEMIEEKSDEELISARRSFHNDLCEV